MEKLSNSPQNNGEQNYNPWSTLKQIGTDYHEGPRSGESFTQSELERLARITNRVPDDEGIIGLNLALRYDKYKAYKEMYEAAKKNHTMLQQGTMEDFATAKRDLEEAIYLYDKTFAHMDEDLHKKQLKDAYKAQATRSTGRNVHSEPGHYLKLAQQRKARLEGIDTQNDHHAGYNENRGSAAEQLSDNLDTIVNEIEQSEVYKTYQLYKDEEPEARISERREGLEKAGKNGLLINNQWNEVDLTLYPHAPSLESKPDDSSNNPNTPDNNPNPDNNPDSNPDSDPNKDPNQDPNNPDDPNNPNDPNNPTDDTEPIEKAKKRNEVDDVRREQELLLELKHSRADLAEAYAKSRRLFGKNRADFIELKEEHSAKLNEFLRLRAKRTYNAEMDSLAQGFKQEYERLCDRVEQDVAKYAQGEGITEEQKDKKKEELLKEAEKQLKEWYGSAQERVEKSVHCRFSNDLVNEAARLEDATIEVLDNGTICRKLVSKIINNKKLRLAMVAAAGVGLGMTGVGLATGAMTIGYSLTAAGAAAGAAKGALSGLVMSRQDSKTSAVRGFVDERQILHEISGIKAAEEGSDTANVADWLMDQYEMANDDDASGNAKRTLISTALGGALGALASGIHLESASTSKTNLKVAVPEKHVTTEQIQTSTTPEHWDVDLSKVNIGANSDGMSTTFAQLGGDPNRAAEATEIAWTFDSKYGMVPGSNGATPGFNGEIGKYAHTYAGRIEDWPEVARSYISEVAEEWAKRGLIPGVKTGGEPIYNTITKTSIDFTTKNLPPITVGTARNTISDTIASVVSGAVVGGTASAVGNREDQTLEEKDPEEVLHFDTQPTPVAPERPQSTEAEQSAEREENAAKEALRHEVLSIINQIPGINAEGIRILTDQGELDDAKRQRIEQWLNDFSQRPENQDAMAALTSYLESRNSDNDRHAYALRQYFNMV